MAAGALGSLVVTLGLDAAQFTAGLTKSEFEAKKWRDSLVGVAKEAGILVAAGAATAATAIVALTKSAIDSADQLNKLSQSTGIATEDLSALAFAAELSDVNTQDLASAMGKLSKSINEASTGVGDQAEAFKALGISVRDSSGNLRGADSVLLDIAERFSGYADGVEKVVLAQAIFGKSGAALIPLLNQGAEGFAKAREEAERLGLIVSGPTAAAAEEFNDTLTKIGAGARGVGLRIAEALLPTLQVLADELLNTSKSSGAAETALGGLRTVFETLAVLGINTKYVLEATGREIGAILAQLALVGDVLTTPPTQLIERAKQNWRQFRAISDAVKEDAERARREVDAATAQILDRSPRLAPDAKGKGDGKKPTAPRLPGAGAVSDAEQLARKALDAQIKGIRDFATEQRDAIAFANQFARGAYEDGTQSLREQFAIQAGLRQEALRTTVQALDQEIAALEAYRRKLTKPTERADADAKIAEAVGKRQQAVTKAAQQGVLDSQAEARAIAELDNRYKDLQATIRQLSGDEAVASKLAIDRQVEAARRLLTQSGRDPAEADRLGVLLTQTNELRNLQQDYNRLLDQQRIAEENILLTAQESGATELETMGAVRQSRQAALEQMALMVQKAQELALALGTPEAQQFADALALGFRKATAEVDPLLTRVKEVAKEMGDSIARSFENAIVNGGSLRDLLGGIAQDILRITTQQLVTKPLAGFLTNAIGSFLGPSFGGGKAIGGPVEAGGLYRVAENRPEMLNVNGESYLLMGNQRGNINPNPQAARSNGQTLNATINVNMPANTSAATANQAGLLVARRLRAASTRNQ
jgi:hypothetical protein